MVGKFLTHDSPWFELLNTPVSAPPALALPISTTTARSRLFSYPPFALSFSGELESPVSFLERFRERDRMGPKFEPTVPKTSTTKGTESVLRGNATAERASANIHGAGISNPPIEPSQSRASNGKHSREIS